jgi:hypothetical protein
MQAKRRQRLGGMCIPDVFETGDDGETADDADVVAIGLFLGITVADNVFVNISLSIISYIAIDTKKAAKAAFLCGVMQLHIALQHGANLAGRFDRRVTVRFGRTQGCNQLTELDKHFFERQTRFHTHLLFDCGEHQLAFEFIGQADGSVVLGHV